MDGMVEENGTTGNPGGDPLAHSPGDNNTSVVVTSVQSSSSQQHHLVAATSIVQLTLPTHVTNNNTTIPQNTSEIYCMKMEKLNSSEDAYTIHLKSPFRAMQSSLTD
uniref:Uncharacterized protein n=1 Tax=Timema bartmani TaxID=61472 RepID=A0A7R9HYJ3_9NEOP|nr:unnamed protein product [Timema bartmani]